MDSFVKCFFQHMLIPFLLKSVQVGMFLKHGVSTVRWLVAVLCAFTNYIYLLTYLLTFIFLVQIGVDYDV